jgi:Matrixin/Putative peptidoglycan binding domain
MATRQSATAGAHEPSSRPTIPPARDPGPTTVLVRRDERDPRMINSNAFLARFGYLDDREAAPDLLDDQASRALRNFQTFYGLEPTGTLTLETLKLMRQPRCAVPDFLPDELGGPGIVDSDPFVFGGTTWPQASLRWFLSGGTPDLGTEASVVQTAFDTWGGLIPRTFVQQTSTTGSQFDVSWQTGDHGDGDSFDGAGTVLAHAFLPQDGRVHFDDAESWGTSAGGGNTDLQSVALHEFGHALGLRHSGNHDAVMYAFISGERRTPHEVDIKGMRSRYPVEVNAAGQTVATIPLWALESTRGCDVVTVDLGRSVELVAWGQVTMVDSRADFDRDNYHAVEVFMVDGDRPGPYLWGGDHLGSDGAPSNCYTGAWVGNARRITFRMSVGHMQDIEAFGTGNIIVLSGGSIG